MTLMEMPYWLRVIAVLFNAASFAMAGWISVVKW